MALQQRHGRGDAMPGNEDWGACAAVDEGGLVADIGWLADGSHFQTVPPPATMAAGYHPRPQPGGAQVLHQRDDGWGFAGAASNDVANDNDWHRQALRVSQPGPVEPTP